MEPRKSGSIFPILLTVLLSALLAGGLLGPGYLREFRSGNERAAPHVIATLCSAEALFRWEDRDGNGIKDYWTADVAGLYRYGLISREIAEADTAPLVPLVPTPIPYKGYYFRALVADDFEIPSVPYRQVTDLKSGAVHHLEKFGFVAYPAGGLFPTTYMWIVCETNTSLRSPMDIPVPVNFPSKQEFLSRWSKVQ